MVQYFIPVKSFLLVDDKKNNADWVWVHMETQTDGAKEPKVLSVLSTQGNNKNTLSSTENKNEKEVIGSRSISSL